ncbi:MAG TPA: hypothetical protein PK017_09450 [Acidobacteriota bacterium]|nr:hypothetical protein [Acidobacteriota bacterium]
MMRRSYLPAVFCLIVGLSGTASLHGAGTPAVDLNQLRRECELFENILNTSLRQNIQNPLFIAEKVRGAYLEGYGVTFTYTVNLNRSMILFPRSTQSATTQSGNEPDLGKTVQILRRCAAEVLSQYGSAFRQLPAQHKISIIAHVLSRSVDPNVQSGHVLVVTATRNDLDQLQRARINADEFKKRIVYLEY